MKKQTAYTLSFLTAVSILSGCSSQSPAAEPAKTAETQETAETAGFTDGSYEGSAIGFHGAVPVTVTVKDGVMTDITVGDNQETYGVGTAIFENQINEILTYQSYNVDTLTGATFTANAVKNAVKDALTKAGAGEGMFDGIPEIEKKDTSYDIDVAVVGAGGAGMAAAIEAASAGASVIVLEKEGRYGGSTSLSGGNMYATNSQLNRSYDNDPDDMYNYFVQRGEGLADPELIRYYADNSGSAIDWAIDVLGADYGDENSVTALGYSDKLRQHHNQNRGGGLTVPEYNKAKELGVQFLFSTKAEELITDENGTVTGVTASDKHGTVTINAKAVVLASGGYDRNRELMEKYSPTAVGSVPITGTGNTGDGLLMAEALGADTNFNDVAGGIYCVDQYAYPEDGANLLTWYGTLFVDDKGNRFTDESDYYVTICDRMLQNDSDVFWWIFDSSIDQEMIEDAVSHRYAVKADTLEELAEAAGMDKTTFTETISRYNGYAETGVDEEFGKTSITPLAEEGPYYALKVIVGTCDSIGGLVTDTNAQVLKEGNPIPGLFAAGELANSKLFGRTYTSDGVMVGSSIVFGRTAGVKAAEYAAEN